MREQILHILTDLDTDPSFADLRLKQALAQKEWARRDRAFITRVAYGVLGKRIYLDYVLSLYSKTPPAKMKAYIRNLLRMGAYQLLFMDKVPDSAACNESVKLAKAYKRGVFAGFVNAVLRRIAREKGHIPLPKREETQRYLAIKYSVSPDIVGLWLRAYGEAYCERLLAALERPEEVVLRVNTLKIQPEELIDRFAAEGVDARPAAFAPQALAAAGGGDLTALESFKQGLFHVQDTSSQLCAAQLEARPGQLVLDLCSAPGGKAFTVAELMEGRGRLLAFDLYPQRSEQIRQGAKRLGLDCIEVNTHDAAEPLPALLGQADRVLCDVPCSGLGILRKKPDIRLKTFTDFSELTAIQRRILHQAAAYLKVGGRLVYATCTINPAENEEIVADFLAGRQAFSLAPLTLPKGLPHRRFAGGGVLLEPESTQMDGFFLCAFTKNGEDVTIS